MNLIHAVLYGLDDNEIRSFAVNVLSSSNRRTILLLAHIPDNRKEDALVIFARSQALERIDCNKLFHTYSYLRAKCGGKPSFFTGVISKKNVNHLMDKLITDLRILLQNKSA